MLCVLSVLDYVCLSDIRLQLGVCGWSGISVNGINAGKKVMKTLILPEEEDRFCLPPRWNIFFVFWPLRIMISSSYFLSFPE